MSGDLENPFAALTAYERRHLVSHLAEAGQHAHSHRVLALETSAGRPAWYDHRLACDNVGAFLDDVSFLWASAQRRAKFGDEVRYALVHASVTSVAGNLPPELLGALFERGVWSLSQSLAYAQRITRPLDRIRAISVLAARLAEPQRTNVIKEAVADVAALGDSSLALATVEALASTAPIALVPDLIVIARGTKLPHLGAPALALLADRLPAPDRGDLAREALALARSAEESVGGSLRRTVCAIGQMRPLMPPPEVLAALDLLEYWADAWAMTAAVLLPALPRNERSRLARALVGRLGDVARAATNALVPAVSAAAESFPPHRRTEVVDAIRSFSDGRDRAVALSAVAALLPEPDASHVAQEALVTCRSIHDGKASIMASLLPRFIGSDREALLAEALAAASAEGWVHGRVALLPHLPASESEVIAREVLALVGSGDSRRTSVIAAIATDLSPAMLREVLDSSERLADAADRTTALKELVGAPKPPAEYNTDWWRTAIEDAALYLGPGDHMVPTTDDLMGRAVGLAALVPDVPGSLLGDILDKIGGLGTGPAVVVALRALAPRLPDHLVHGALAVARSVADVDSRAAAIVAVGRMAPEAAAEAIAETLQAAWAKPRARDRAFPLAILLPMLSDGALSSAYDEVRAVAQTTDFAGTRVTLLMAMLPFAERGDREQILSDALAAAGSLLAGYDDPSGQHHLVHAIEELAPHLSLSYLDAAWNMVSAMTRRELRSRAFAALLPRLESATDEQVTWLWRQAVSRSAGRSRSDLLSDLARLAGVLKRLGGPTACVGAASAIGDVGRWWGTAAES